MIKPGDKVVCTKKFSVDCDSATPVLGEICTVSDKEPPYEVYEGHEAFCLEGYSGSWTMAHFKKHIPKEKLTENADLWEQMVDDDQ